MLSRTLSCEDDILQLPRLSCRALKPRKNGQNRLKILPSDDSIVVGVAVPTLVEEKDHGGHLAFAKCNQFRKICSRGSTEKQVGKQNKSQICISINPCGKIVKYNLIGIFIGRT